MPTRAIQVLLAFVIELACIFVLGEVCGVWVAHWGASGHETIAANVAGSVAGGVLGNFAYRALSRIAEAVGAWPFERGGSQLPAHHYIARALWDAVLRAVTALADETLRIEQSRADPCDRSAYLSVSRAERFRRAIAAWERGQRRLLKQGSLDDTALSAAALVVGDLAALVRAGETGWGRPWPESSAIAMGAILGQDLARSLKEPPPPEFLLALTDEGRADYRFNLGQRASSYFMERVETDPRIYRALSMQLQAEAAAGVSGDRPRLVHPDVLIVAPAGADL